MSNEIKEILDEIRGQLIVSKEIPKDGLIAIRKKCVMKLLNYITNLQQIEEEHRKINGELRVELEETKKHLHSAAKVIDELIDVHKENKRLNNIINELEKWLENKNDEYIDMESDDAFVIRLILDKLKELKELKGDDNNVR